MKQYMLTLYQPDGEPPPAARLETIMRDVEAVNEEIRASGGWVFAAKLLPPETATVVRTGGEPGTAGPVITTDGPYAEGKEHIGGFSIVSAPDLDAALAWARKFAVATTLPIEVRPVHSWES